MTWENIPGSQDWVGVCEIKKGWSRERKVRIETKTGDRLLLRTASHVSIDRRRFEDQWMNHIYSLGIRMPRSLGYGEYSAGTYALMSWVDGEDAEVSLPRLSTMQQYTLGVTAGEVLSKIHSIAAPSTQPDWGGRFRRKIHRGVEEYKRSSVRVKNDQKILDFLERNLWYLDHRPQTLQHGDFHVGNLVINNRGDLGVIDFNRMDFGDPWEEFNRIIFSWRASIPFTLGQIHGYFRGEVPPAFFSLSALYIAFNAIGSIPWALGFGDEDLAHAIQSAEDIYNVYDGFNTVVPRWYQDQL